MATLNRVNWVGNWLSSSDESDMDGDGIYEYRSQSTVTYDEQGRQTNWTQTTDFDGDGVIDESVSTDQTYDAAGNVSSVVTHGGKGGANSTTTTLYTYTVAGIATTRTEIDNEGDGTLDYISEDAYTYGEDGWIVSIQTSIDRDGDGVFDEVNTNGQEDVVYYYFDGIDESAASGESKAQFDLNADGKVDNDDRIEFMLSSVNSYVGDVNFDGMFSSEDLVIVFQSGTFEDDDAGNSNWFSGDWDGDGEFTTADLVFAFQAGGYEVGPRESTASELDANATDRLMADADLLGAALDDEMLTRV